MELSLLCNSHVLLCIVENGKTVLFSSDESPLNVVNESLIPAVMKGNFLTLSKVSFILIFYFLLSKKINLQHYSTLSIVDLKKPLKKTYALLMS